MHALNSRFRFAPERFRPKFRALHGFRLRVLRSLDLSFEILKTFKSESESLWQRVWASGLDDAVWRQERTANQETDADDDDDVEEEDDDQHERR